jgi:L-lactate dehydrogenase complex protein LldE
LNGNHKSSQALAEITQISLFIPCLVETVYPEMGLAMVQVLKALGYTVSYKHGQTCCGQPAFNSGYRADATRVAATFLDIFDDSEVIVAPSGSCTAMVRNYFPPLFKDSLRYDQATAVANRVYEFSEFLCRSGSIKKISGSFPGRIGFHNSCHSYRELRLDKEPMDVLARIEGFELVHPAEEFECCGFGGLFSVKFPGVAAGMAKFRLGAFTEHGINTLVSNDPGCIMHLRQEADSLGSKVKIIHLTEFLAEAMNLH